MQSELRIDFSSKESFLPVYPVGQVFGELGGKDFSGGKGIKQMVAADLEFLAGQTQAMNKHIVH